ncbi:MAG TPA: NAD-dependent succinate-semialdehyde dehydrogenase [Geopsychrobacteraceae bacterium]|nr:NAD-dependent succinate-semialdehyde dehydrogenase [Geopsychrobacteraceae bacterium]
MMDDKLKDSSLLRDAAYIDGEWVAADDRSTLQVTNPATGEIIAQVAKVGAKETSRAISAANAAWTTWRNHTAQQRCDLLRKWHDLILQHQDDLALLMTLEQGKPLQEARGEIAYAASFIDWFAEEGKRIYGDVIPQHDQGKRLLVLKQPVGVCAAITPWNFPAAMITRKAGPALAAGCTMVVKPASATPLSALALAELSCRAGIPRGVFNVVTGSAEVIGTELTSNPLVRKVTFTGSTETGKKLLVACSDTLKKVTMELGGNAPLIVFDDADLDAAVEGAIASKFRNNGQTCVCTNRFLVQAGIYDEFCRKLVEKVGGLKVGNGLAEETYLGPLINRAAVESVENHIADALDKGAELICGGKRHKLGGNFFEPTVLTGATDEMSIAVNEIFGPVAPLYRFEQEEDAIRLANDTDYGLASYFYTRDLARAWRVSEALEYGIVGLNTGLISTAVAPFGGIKQSGLGREGSKYGIDAYLEIKYLCMGEIE